MKKYSKILIGTLAFILCLCVLILQPKQVGAFDFGDFSGDSDYGGSDWGSSDWESSSDWGSSSSWSSSSDWGSSSSSGSSYYSSSGSDDDGFFVFVGVVLVALFIYWAVSGVRKAFRGGSTASARPVRNVAPGATRTEDSRLKPMASYAALDPCFDESALREQLSNLYVKMQNAWTEKDITPVRPYFTDAYYAQMERQCDRMRQQGLTNYVDRIAVLGIELRGYYQLGGIDHIIAEVRTRIVDYTVNDATGALVKGSRSTEKFMTYEWDLTRKSGLVTGKTDGISVVNCPNCGAPLNINATAKCPYCDSVVTVQAKNWTILNIRGISQRSVN